MAVRICAVVAAAFALGSLAAAAQTRPAEQAAEMLARAQALDVKCNILNAHDRDKLSKFTARAELALANRESLDLTKAVMLRGKAAADAASCTTDERATIRQLLSAALEASGEPPDCRRA
jgi:hypothetical protein